MLAAVQGRRAVTIAASLATLVALAVAPAGADTPGTPDCTGPAGDPQPGTTAWHQREADSAYCGEQRAYDIAANPAYARAKAELYARTGREVQEDAFRDPPLWQG